MSSCQLSVDSTHTDTHTRLLCCQWPIWNPGMMRKMFENENNISCTLSRISTYRLICHWIFFPSNQTRVLLRSNFVSEIRSGHKEITFINECHARKMIPHIWYYDWMRDKCQIIEISIKMYKNTLWMVNEPNICNMYCNMLRLSKRFGWSKIEC